MFNLLLSVLVFIKHSYDHKNEDCECKAHDEIGKDQKVNFRKFNLKIECINYNKYQCIH